MADPVIQPTNPPALATISPASPPNGNGEQPFGTSMEQMLQKAFEEARPDPFKPKAPTESKPRVVGENHPAHEDQPAETKVPETKAPARAAQWKEVNEDREKLRKEVETLKSEQEKWSKSQIDRTEYDTIKKTNDELLAKIKAIAVEKDPRFESYFKTKTDTAIALARQAVGDSHSERVSKLLQLPDSDWRTEQLETVMSELGPTRQSRLGAAIVEMDRINLERSTAISKSQENWESMRKADLEQQQGQAKEFERAFQNTLEKWTDKEKGLPLFQMRDGDEAHNAEVNQRVETARNILNMRNLSAEQLSKAALWSAAAPGLLKNQMALAEENRSLKAEIEALKAGGPELNGGSDEQKQVDDEKQWEGMDVGSIIASKVKKAGGWNR